MQPSNVCARDRASRQFGRMFRETQGAIRLRLLTGLFLAGVAAVLIWVPQLHLVFTLALALMVGLGLYEYYGMAEKCGLDVDARGGIAVGVALLLSAYLGKPAAFAAMFTLGFGLLAVAHMARNKHSLAGLAASIFGVIYVAWMGSHLVALHGIGDLGPGLVTLVIGAVALSDTGAYFVGSAIGKHKMAPALSPKKSWEGALGGIAFACILMGLVAWGRPHLPAWMLFPDWSLGYYLFLGALLSVAGQIGDFMESMLKRNAGIKDSGAFFPGHGGVLDRCDGFLFAGPVMYYTFTLL